MRSVQHKSVLHPLLIGSLLAAFGAAAPLRAADDEQSGREIYKTRCAACHGTQGAGTAKQKRRLEGDKSVAQLTELIAQTMPEDDPGSLQPEQAAAVAVWVHDTFYSRIARERNRPARVELARLTVRQYRLALADLVGSFRQPVKWGDERGVRGFYFKGRRLGGRNNRAAERTDPQINFDFGTEAPVSEIDEPHEFSIRWNGSILAQETGEYEFVIRTEHAARLWINDMNRALIDAWVKSGSDTEYKGSLFLVGGRPYQVQVEFTKAKQGVDDSKKQKEKPASAKASMALLWKRPRGALEPISSRQFSTATVPESFVCTTAFPPDDRSYGWERGTAVSKAWDQSTTSAAIEAANYIVAHLEELAGKHDGGSDRVEKTFCRTFAERAFRRPLTDDEARLIVDRQFEGSADREIAVKRAVLLTLKSPRFLYREVRGGMDPFDTAARLSFGLWNSIPDQELREAAAAGRLTTPDQIAREAERMLQDLKARNKLREFLLTWLKADAAGDLAKNSEKFPDFDAAVVSDLRTSLELFLDDVLAGDASDLRRLFTTDEVFMNDRLAKFYGAPVPVGGDFTRINLESEHRAGVLTHPYLMAAFAHTSESSPIHRGLFLVRGMLGQSLRPPPEAVAPVPPDLHPDLTTRERVSLQTQAASCMTCHAIINPLGFTLENYDAVGRYRESDRGKQVDTTGSYRTRAGKVVTVNGTWELADFLAHSEDTQGAFTEQLFHHLVQQPVLAYGTATLADLRQSFAASDCNIRKLAVRIMVASALVGRETEPKPATDPPAKAGE